MPHIRIVTASELSSKTLLARDYIEDSNGKNFQHEVGERRLGEAVEARPCGTARTRGDRAAQPKPLAKTKG